MSKDREITAEYVAELELRLAASEAKRTASETARIAAQTENTRLAAHLKIAEELRVSLERMLVNARHEKFGAKSEKLNADQQNLPFEERDFVRHWFENNVERSGEGDAGCSYRSSRKGGRQKGSQTGPCKA